MKRNRFLLLLLPFVALILEIIPYGAVCNFALPATDGTIGHFRELYSYFDLLPFGYANFGPFMTAITTCVIIVVLTFYAFLGRDRALSVAKKLLYVGVVFSLGPILLGIHFLSAVGVLITLSLIAELIFLQRCFM